MHGEDLAEIQQVAALYGHVIDRQLWDRMGEVYAPEGTYDGTATGSGVHEGVSAIVDYLSKSRQPVVHHVTNLYIEAFEDGGKRARGCSKWLVMRDDETIASGDYEDQWIKTGDGWRLLRRASSRRGGLPPPQ